MLTRYLRNGIGHKGQVHNTDVSGVTEDEDGSESESDIIVDDDIDDDLDLLHNRGAACLDKQQNDGPNLEDSGYDDMEDNDDSGIHSDDGNEDYDEGDIGYEEL